MCTLTNVRDRGDAYPTFFVIGFTTPEEAFTFVQNDYSSKGLTPALKRTLLTYGQSVECNTYMYVVFYAQDKSGDWALMGIVQIASDLPALNIGSWGSQLLIEKP